MTYKKIRPGWCIGGAGALLGLAIGLGFVFEVFGAPGSSEPLVQLNLSGMAINISAQDGLHITLTKSGS